MLAMVVNDDAGYLMPRGAPRFFVGTPPGACSLLQEPFPPLFEGAEDQLDNRLHLRIALGLGIHRQPHLALHRLAEQPRQTDQATVEIAHVGRQQADAGAATDHLQHQWIGMRLHDPGQALVDQVVPGPKTVDLSIMLPLHQHEIGQVIETGRPRGDS